MFGIPVITVVHNFPIFVAPECFFPRSTNQNLILDKLLVIWSSLPSSQTYTNNIDIPLAKRKPQMKWKLAQENVQGS